MKRFIVLFLLPGFLITSCVHNYYVPHVQNVPLFKNKGEFQLSGHWGGGSYTSGFDLQTALSLTNNMAVAANFKTVWDSDFGTDDNFKGHGFEGAVGYFKQMGKKEVFEIFGGIGTGNQDHQYDYVEFDYYESIDRIGNARLSTLEFYLQPAYGFRLKNGSLAFSTRVSSVSFNRISSTIDRNSSQYADIQSLLDKNHFFIEPAVTFRIGWGKFKFQLQYLYSGNLSHNTDYKFEKQYFSIGLHYLVSKGSTAEILK